MNNQLKDCLYPHGVLMDHEGEHSTAGSTNNRLCLIFGPAHGKLLAFLISGPDESARFHAPGAFTNTHSSPPWQAGQETPRLLLESRSYH
jgi:hypothetical protein